MEQEQFYTPFFLLSVLKLPAYVCRRVFEGGRSLEGGTVKIHQMELEMDDNFIFI